jgi:2-dehydro-3-deoxygalactonokinase
MTPAPTLPDWIAADWGTTHLRLWAMEGPRILAQAQSDDGMGRLDRAGFEAALLRLAAPWLAEGRVTEVLACGMVGSRQGWVEAPYLTTPCAPLDPSRLVVAPTTDPRLRVRIVPGIRQLKPQADVMRGEETQIAGFLARNPRFDGVLCLPGTHCKWVHVSAGEVVSFATYMTGEMFDLLSTASVLRHGVAGWDDSAFLPAVAEAFARPERLAARLFSIRAEGLLTGLAPDAARARLSGLLIGAELAGARPYWLGQEVAVIGAGPLAECYRAALAAQGAQVRVEPVADLTLAGLAQARQMLRAVA